MFLFFKHNVNFVLKIVVMADLNVELVKQLSNNIDKLKDQYLGLKQEVNLLQGEKVRLLKQLEDAAQSYVALNEQFKVYKLSRSFAGEGENNSETKKKINQIVREIDKCIALLNR